MKRFENKINTILNKSSNFDMRLYQNKPDVIKSINLDKNNKTNIFDDLSCEMVYSSNSFNIFYSKNDETKKIIPLHLYDTNLYDTNCFIFIISGSIRYLEYHKEIDSSIKIEKNQKSTFLIPPHTEFFIIFVPPIKVSMHE